GAYARYVVGVARSALPHAGLVTRVQGDDWESALRSEVEGQLEGGSLVVLREIDGLKKKIDVRSWLRKVSVGRGGDVLERAGFVGALVPIEVEVALAGSGGVKIAEVVEALLNKDVPHRAIRATMWSTRSMRAVAPLELEKLRIREHVFA